MSSTQLGFILTRHALDKNGRCQLLYYGISNDGPFKIVISNHRPLFFIERNSDIPELKGMQRRSLELTNFNLEPVDGLYFNNLDSYFNGKRTLRESGYTTYESDIRPKDRYLMERHINGSVLIQGNCTTHNNLTVWKDPIISRGDFKPALKWLSLDIETGENGTIYSFALHVSTDGAGIQYKKVLMRDDEGSFQSGSDIQYCPNERQLILQFLKEVKNNDPDIIIGWHVIGFDLMFIMSRCEKLSIPFKMGRGPNYTRISEFRSGQYDVQIEGRVIVDGPPTLRSAFFSFDNYKLETVAQELLGRGKDIASDSHKVAEIERRFKEDKPALAKYNLEDAVLVTEIFKKTEIVQQLITRSLIAGLTIDKVHMSVASFDHFMLPAIHRNGLVAPDVADITVGDHAAGGHVFTSEPGLYEYVAVLDFKSLYPTIMRTFFIDPISRIRRERSTVNTPVDIKFSQTDHALPDFLEKLMAKREEAKISKNRPLAQAVKILMNSFYGVMGTPGSRFYHWELPTAITGTGQWVLKESASFLRGFGYNVIYGDTDSVFVCLKKEEHKNPEKAGEELKDRLNSFFRAEIKEEFGLESKLEMEFEKYYRKFFLPAMRGTTEGSRKRYVGCFQSGKLEMKGMEFVRSDWTDLAKDFQFELFTKYFLKEDLKEWIKETVKNLKSGKYDDKLVYKRRLKKSASEYTKTTPPHIKAIRLIDPEDKQNIRSISYLITKDGPVPMQFNPKNIDYNHYIEKQLKPIADGVLFTLGETFDGIVEGIQLELF